MSKIIEKAFDATKKIIRSVFLGSPNLITSSDLNRQMEAFKYQLDLLDDKTGMIIEGVDLKHAFSSSTLIIDFKCESIKFKGCQFYPEAAKLSINFTIGAPLAYLCLTAEQEVVTYENDSSHEIAGAKFADGTSYPAANQVVYKNEALILTHALSEVENLVGVIAYFKRSDTGNLIIEKNFISNVGTETLAMSKDGVIKDFNSSYKGKVTNGTPYNKAFSAIENRFTHFSNSWDSLVDSSGNSTSFMFMIRNGIFYMKIPEQIIQPVFTKTDRFVYTVGYFPSSVKNFLINYFNGLGIDLSYTLKSNNPVVYGDLGTFACHRREGGSDSDTTGHNNGFGDIKLCFLITASDGVVTDVTVGFYLDNWVDVDKNTKLVTGMFDGPVSFVFVGDVSVIFIKKYVVMPLFGG